MFKLHMHTNRYVMQFPNTYTVFFCFYLTYALSFPVKQSTHTTCLHSALSCAAAFIFTQLHLTQAVFSVVK